MKIPPDRTFFEQARLFDLRWCCEDCVFFHEASGLCVHGFPNEDHRRAHYERPVEFIISCKDFELR